jgi:hypothetical protein
MPRLTQGQAIWAIRIVAPVVVLIIVTVLLAVFGFVSAGNASVVGALLALVGVLITQIANTNIARSGQRHQQELEDQRAQDNALQRYLDQISDTKTYEALRKAAEGGYKRAVMRAKMKTLLLVLDEGRKGILLQFLNEAKLIKKKQYLRSNDKKESRWNYPILGLEGLDFSGAKLHSSIEVDFSDLSGVNLSDADLSGATLRGVNLRNADLRGANLSKAKLLQANLWEVEAYEEREGPRDQLLKMDLSGADLRGSNLEEADLTGADLTGADLRDAKNLKRQQLDKTTGNGTTQLPNGLAIPGLWSKAT